MNNFSRQLNGCWSLPATALHASFRDVLIGSVFLATLLGFANMAKAGSEETAANQPGIPQPPETGTPRGHTQPGTRRPEASCRETDVPLTALVANNGSDLSVSAQPTFLFYVPFKAEEIDYMEFVLLDGSERETVFRSAVKLMDEPGLIRVQLPADGQVSLNVGEDYRWYFKLDCLPDRSDAPDLVLDGWMRYVGEDVMAANENEAGFRAYEECEYWYDAISSLALLHFSEASNSEWADDWSDLMVSLGYGELAGFPMVESWLFPVAD